MHCGNTKLFLLIFFVLVAQWNLENQKNMLHGTFVCKCTNYANYGFEKLMYHICSSCQEERALEMYTLAAHAKNKGHWKCEPLVYEAKPALKNTTVILGKTCIRTRILGKCYVSTSSSPSCTD